MRVVGSSSEREGMDHPGIVVERPSTLPVALLSAPLLDQRDFESEPVAGRIDASLVVAPLAGKAIALGRFQRAASSIDLEGAKTGGHLIVRRATGGPALLVGDGQLYVGLKLPSARSLGGIDDVARALNRHVRPLLRALSSFGSVASWTGRDVVFVRNLPIAWVGIRHVRATGAIGIEAIIATRASFELPPPLDLAFGAIAPRFRGRTPAPLEAVYGRTLDEATLASRIVEAYAERAGSELQAPIVTVMPERPPEGMLLPDLDQPPFVAMVEESIGLLGAVIHEDSVALGGDLMVSDDVLDPLGRTLFRLGADATPASLGQAINATLAPTAGALLVGVRRLDSFEKLIRAAWQAGRS